MNRRYIASQDQAVAASLAPYADTIETLAAAQALRSFSEHTDGRLPSTIVGLPPDLGGLLGSVAARRHNAHRAASRGEVGQLPLRSG